MNIVDLNAFDCVLCRAKCDSDSCVHRRRWFSFWKVNPPVTLKRLGSSTTNTKSTLANGCCSYSELGSGGLCLRFFFLSITLEAVCGNARVSLCLKVGIQCAGLRSGQQEGSAGGLPGDSLGSRRSPGGQWILPLHHT